MSTKKLDFRGQGKRKDADLERRAAQYRREGHGACRLVRREGQAAGHHGRERGCKRGNRRADAYRSPRRCVLQAASDGSGVPPDDEMLEQRRIIPNEQKKPAETVHLSPPAL